MSVNPGAVGRPADPGSSGDGAGALQALSPDQIARLAHAYLDTYRGPHDAPAADASVTLPVDMTSRQMMGPGLVTAHHRLGRHRPVGDTRVAVYGADDPGGFGPALQIVTDYTPMVMDSVTVLLHRFGVSYTAIMNPVFRVRRSPAGELLDMRPPADVGASREGVDECWIHVAARTGRPTARRSPRSRSSCPVCWPTRVRSRSTPVGWQRQCAGWRTNSTADPGGRFPGRDRKDVAALLRWLADGHFILLGYQRCSVSDGRASVDLASRLGVLRLRQDVLPQLTHNNDLLVLAQATIPSYLRYGAYPYIVVVREQSGDVAIEHRFVGLFTVAATNANVLEIPLISATGARGSGASAARPEPSRPIAARHHPDHSTFGTVRAVRPGTSRHGQGRRRPRFSAAHAAVHASRFARPLRLVSRLSAP